MEGPHFEPSARDTVATPIAQIASKWVEATQELGYPTAYGTADRSVSMLELVAHDGTPIYLSRPERVLMRPAVFVRWLGHVNYTAAQMTIDSVPVLLQVDESGAEAVPTHTNGTLPSAINSDTILSLLLDARVVPEPTETTE